MKQDEGPTQELSMAHLRQTRLVAACGPVWLFILGINAAALVRSVLTLLLHGQSLLLQTTVEVIQVVVFMTVMYLPKAAIRLHRPDMLPAACITAHAMNSLLLCLKGWGITAFTAATRGVLATRGAELLVDMVLTYQYQLSLPIMALLHAFRQAAWMSIILWRMDGDLKRLLVRGFGNWALLMLFSAFLEMRLRAAHRKACRDVQQQQQEQQQKLQGKQEQHPGYLQSADDVAQQVACVHSQAKESTLKSTSDLPAGASPDQTNASPQLSPGEARTQPPAVPPRAAAREAHGMSSLGSMQKEQPVPHQQQAALALLQAVQSQHASPYKRIGHGKSNTVHVKVEGIELEHLPPDLPELLHKQLSYCMPGVTMTGLALRSGCVMLTLDLARCAEEGTAAWSADSMRDLITRLMQSQAMGQVLEDGAPMCIQMPDELALCRWDSASGSYTSEGAPALDLADWYSCRMVRTGPAVHCLSDNATHTPRRSASLAGTPASHQLTLTVELELPSNCQLHGWQPAGVAAPAGSGGLLHDSSQESPVVDAMLLARRLDGGYLPVVVQQLPGVGKSSGDTATHQITAQVVVSVAGEDPAALHLELWCKQADAAGKAVGASDNLLSWVPGHMPGLELLVAHMPLLVVPGSWKEAAAELQQHIDDIGGVKPQHALPPHMASTNVNSCRTSKPSTLDLSPDTVTLHDEPPGASQPVVNTEQPKSGQPVQPKRSPLASDSASSHNPPHSQRPPDDAGCDPVCCLLEDVGALLTHQPSASATCTGQVAAVPPGMVSQLGDDLLVYAVQHGLASVASVIVDTLQRVEQQCAVGTAARPAIVSHSAWLLRVAGCASNSDSDGLQGGSGRRMSLLQAAMASGNVEMLGHVFRWGTVYGGPDWAWPWELENAAGCTALHLAAAQPVAGACAALLKTIACMLSAAQVQAARNAWLHCQGGLGSTPAQLFDLASNGGNVGEMWGDVLPLHATSTLPGSTTDSMGAGPSATSSSGSPPATTSAAIVEPAATQAQSWLGSMVEVWTSRQPEEYHAWAKRQDLLSIWYWAAALFVISAAAMHRSAVADTLQYEWPHLSLYTWFMIPAVVATAGGNEWLGNSKVWLVLAQVLPICSWIAKSRLRNHQAVLWISTATTGADMIYVLLVGVAIDKVPVPQLVLSRAIEVLFHSHAYRTAGFAYSFLRAMAVQVLVVVVSMVLRTRKLRAFYRWQARQQDQACRSPAERLMVKKRA